MRTSLRGRRRERTRPGNCRALAAAGLTVVAVDRNEVGLKELPTASAARWPTPPTRRCRSRSSTGSRPRSGRPDILVNTIGAYELGDALAMTPETLSTMMDVNLGAALWLTQAVAPHMRERGSGAIVHVSARPGLEPTPGSAAYGVSKAALVHLTRTLDVELRPHGIRVNAVAPRSSPRPRTRPCSRRRLLAGAVEPEAIAEVIAFLVSDAAAPVSGAIVPTYG